MAIVLPPGRKLVRRAVLTGDWPEA